MIVHSRADGHSAVKSAAYAARASFQDARIGKKYSYRHRGGLLSHEVFNWIGDAESLWNAAEKSETRCNARVIRELRPALPAELSLEQQVRLIRKFCRWLLSEYGVAIQANLHAPRFVGRGQEKALTSATSKEAEHAREELFDPTKSNLNFHAHILMTTRKVDPVTGEFGAKTRDLDDKTKGPKKLLEIRKAWEEQTNAALEEAGSDRRVDLRSYAAMAAAGDAPTGLIPQDHLGSARSERGRRIQAEERIKFTDNIRLLAPRTAQAIRVKTHPSDWDTSDAGVLRREIRQHNEDLWRDWTLKRAKQREKARDDELGFAEALQREAARKEAERKSISRLRAARTHADVEAALGELGHVDATKTDSALRLAMEKLLAKNGEEPTDEFSQEVDLEVFEPSSTCWPEPVLEIRYETKRSRSR